MIYSVFNHRNSLYTYFEAPGESPPYAWFRKATPGGLRRPEEIAVKLPAGARLIGRGPLPRGKIATDIPGVGTTDSETPGSGRGAGLAGLGVAFPAQYVAPRLAASEAWETADTRGDLSRYK